MNRLDFIKKVLLLSDKELEEVITGKDSSSLFAIYMAAVNFGDVHIWASTDNMQVRGINYIYSSHRDLINRLLELRVKPNWMG